MRFSKWNIYFIYFIELVPVSLFLCVHNLISVFSCLEFSFYEINLRTIMFSLVTITITIGWSSYYPSVFRDLAIKAELRKADRKDENHLLVAIYCTNPYSNEQMSFFKLLLTNLFYLHQYATKLFFCITIK